MFFWRAWLTSNNNSFIWIVYLKIGQKIILGNIENRKKVIWGNINKIKSKVFLIEKVFNILETHKIKNYF